MAIIGRTEDRALLSTVERSPCINPGSISFKDIFFHQQDSKTSFHYSSFYFS